MTVLAVMVGLHPVSQCCAAKLVHHMGVGISIKCLVHDANMKFNNVLVHVRQQHACCLNLTNNCSSMNCLLLCLQPQTDPLLAEAPEEDV